MYTLYWRARLHIYTSYIVLYSMLFTSYWRARLHICPCQYTQEHTLGDMAIERKGGGWEDRGKRANAHIHGRGSSLRSTSAAQTSALAMGARVSRGQKQK